MQLTDDAIRRYNDLYKAGNDHIRGLIILDKQPLRSSLFPWEKWRLWRGIRKFRRALEIAPQQWQCHFWMGKAFQRLGASSDAFQAFEEARRLAPDNSSVLKEAANAALEVERPELAVAFLRPACQVAPSDVALKHNLALALFLVGNTKEAEILVREVLATDSDHNSSWLLQQIQDVRRGIESLPRSFGELKSRT